MKFTHDFTAAESGHGEQRKKFAVVLLFPIDNASYTALSGDR